MNIDELILYPEKYRIVFLRNNRILKAYQYKRNGKINIFEFIELDMNNNIFNIHSNLECNKLQINKIQLEQIKLKYFI